MCWEAEVLKELDRALISSDYIGQKSACVDVVAISSFDRLPAVAFAAVRL